MESAFEMFYEEEKECYYDKDDHLQIEDVGSFCYKILTYDWKSTIDLCKSCIDSKFDYKECNKLFEDIEKIHPHFAYWAFRFKWGVFESTDGKICNITLSKTYSDYIIPLLEEAVEFQKMFFNLFQYLLQKKAEDEVEDHFVLDNCLFNLVDNDYYNDQVIMNIRVFKDGNRISYHDNNGAILFKDVLNNKNGLKKTEFRIVYGSNNPFALAYNSFCYMIQSKLSYSFCENCHGYMVGDNRRKYCDRVYKDGKTCQEIMRDPVERNKAVKNDERLNIIQTADNTLRKRKSSAKDNTGRVRKIEQGIKKLKEIKKMRKSFSVKEIEQKVKDILNETK